MIRLVPQSACRQVAPLLIGALIAGALVVGALTAAPAAGAAPAATPASAGTAERSLRQVLFVGNNWDGTADVIEPAGAFGKIGRLNIVPDREERLREIYLNPIKLAYFLGVRNGPGEGHDQLVDDLYSSPDGSAVVASRPSFADVVSIDLATGRLNWRFPVSGYRSDHMALSPDGRRVAVSASTSNTVHVLDAADGRELGSFRTGDKPHENVFTGDGLLWNMAIGEVHTPLDAPALDWTKGDRRITVVDAATLQPIRVIDMRDWLNTFGRPDLSDAVRPVAFTPDESKLYFQVSFFNGFLEYDVATDAITRIKELPKNPATSEDRTTWVNDSRHHGLAMSPSGDKLCVAGTVDEYVTVVDRVTLSQGPLIPAAKPYWATISGDGRSCVISESGADQITAIDFTTGQKLTSIPVGDHPQRIRLGKIPTTWPH